MLENDKQDIFLIEKISEKIKVQFCQYVNLPYDAINDEDSFFSLGLTSLIHQEFLNFLSKEFGELSSTVLFEYPNFKLLSGHLNEIQNLKDVADEHIPEKMA